VIAEVSFTTEGVVAISTLLGALAGVIVYLFRQLDSTHKERLSERTSERDSYKEMAHEALIALESRVNEKRRGVGQGPFPAVAPVVPEHNSPVSKRQQETADLQTMRARLTAATLALGLEPRTSGDPEGTS